MDGADKRAWHLYCGLLAAGMSGVLVGRTSLVQGEAMAESHSPARSWRDHKALAALAALLSGADYWRLKLVRPGARRVVGRLAPGPEDAVVVNFLYALPLLPRVGQPFRLLVDTHNYDPACFRALAAEASNLLLRWLCYRAAHCSERALRELPFGTTLVHVSGRDACLYRQHRPDLQHVVVENGTSVRPRSAMPDYSPGIKRILLFVGSLSAQMNQDALSHFATRFWPSLRTTTEFRVAGSAPPARLMALCSQLGWRLFPNVEERFLDQLYAEAHFAVLPFSYGEGSKLKLFEACGRGVPVLSTRAGVVGVPRLAPLVKVGDGASVWQRETERAPAPSAEDINATLAFAEEFSWPNLARKFLRAIEHSKPVQPGGRT